MSSFSNLVNPWVKSLGVYEPGKPIETVARDIGFSSVEDIIKLASNENALGPSKLAIKAMKQAASRMHFYPDGGSYHLRQAISKKMGLKPEEIIPTTGSNEAIELLGHAFLGENKDIVMADRAFVVYALIAKVFRSGVVMVPMKDFTHDLDAMLKAISPSTRIVFISNPNNPTSTMVGQEEIDRFMAHVPDSVIVCFDEAYIELLPKEKQVDTLKYVRAGRNVVVLRTFSKTYGLAGLRIGYAAAPEECIALFNRVRQPFNVNSMAMAAVIAALNDDNHVLRTQRLVVSGLRFYRKNFNQMGLRYVPAVANFILVEVGKGREVFEAMQKEGVIVRPMDPYGLPDHIRITVGTKAENVRCIEVLKKVLASR